MNPVEEWKLNTAHIGRRVVVFDKLDSTNTYGLRLAGDRANDGLVVLADEQGAGRGQQGRAWSCPAGAGVLMSVLVFPPPALCKPAILTGWAAVSVCEVIQGVTGLQAKIKWPNDVLVHDRKVCGILVEQTKGTVVGIGLNVNQSDEQFKAAGLANAGSLAVFAKRDWNTRDLAKQLIAQLDTEFDQLLKGNLESLEARWTTYLGLVGKRVQIDAAGEKHRGGIMAMTFEHLCLELSDGNLIYLATEGVRQIQWELV